MTLSPVAVLLGALASTIPTAVVPDELDDRVAAMQAEAGEAESAGDLDRADELLAEAISLLQDADRPTAAVDLQYGRLLYWNGIAGEGRALLYRAANQRPGDAEIALALVDALVQDRDDAFGRGEFHVADAALAEATKALDPVRGVNEVEREIRLRTARILSRTAGEEASSVPMYMVLLREAPNDAELHREFVTVLPVAQSFEQALGFYQGLDMERGLRLWFLGEVHVARAHWLFQQQEDDEQALADYREAQKLIREAARFRADYFSAAVEYASYYEAWAGWVLLRLDRKDQAWEAFTAALGRFAGNTSAIGGLEQLGFLYYDNDQIDRAREIYRELCYWQPNNANHWNNYGLMCRDTGEYEEGFRAYKRAMELVPDDPRLVNDTALMLQYHLLRDLDLAEQWLLQARERSRELWQSASDPAVADEQLLVYGDSLVNLWRLYDQQGKMEEASAMRAELAEADPTRPELGESGG